VLLPETTAEDALAVAQRLRKDIANQPIPTGAGDLPITVSIGLAVPSKPSSELSDLLREADEALYAAKRAGRNRVVIDTAT
jgi:diguanylate cyclase (GGDEF)-like protein